MVLPADRRVHTSARCSAAVTAEEMERIIDEGLDAETAGSERRQLEEDDSTAADMGELQDDVMFRAVCQSALTAAESDGFLISSFPKEIVFLSGAPGAGKRSMAAWVSSTRGFTAPAIQMKELLHRHGHDVEAARIDDLIAFEELLMELMSGNYADGVVVIGFPRTAGQVAALKVLQQMLEVERRERSSFEPVPRAVFRFVELYVEPRKSISRQMDAPGKRWSKTEAEERYQTYRDHGTPTLVELRKHFAYSLIDTNAPMSEVQDRIMKELAYQSTMELSAETHELVYGLPTARRVAHRSRQQLVARLDDYQATEPELFADVVADLELNFYPPIVRHALGGRTVVRSQNPIYHRGTARDMAVDVLTERGFSVMQSESVRDKAIRMDRNTLEFIYEQTPTFYFEIRFPTEASKA